MTNHKGETLELRASDGIPFQVYVSGSDAARRGVLICHEWWGVTDHNRVWADEFAEQGYKAVVLDLFDGQVAEDPDEARDLVRQLDRSEADAKMTAALDLLDTPHRSIAAYGVSFGGRQALCAAILAPDKVSATVVGYCRLETALEKLRELAGPVFVINAEQEGTWPAKQEAFEAAMKVAGQRTESVSFDAAHGFTNPTSPKYDVEADREAWQATLDFLDRELA
jgi:carboxymethylenebutenolidase